MPRRHLWTSPGPPELASAPALGLLEALADAVTLHAPDGRIVAANAAAAALCGVAPEELAGLRPFRLAAPGWRGRRDAAAAFREAAAGEPRMVRFEGRAPGGERFQVEARLSGAAVEGRRVVVAVSRTVAPACDDCEARLAALLDNAPDVVDIVDPDGTVRYVSPAVERILGWRPDEVVGKSSMELLDPEQLPQVRAALAAVAGNPGGRNPPVELRMRHRDGSWRTLLAQSTNLLHDPAVRGIVVNARDVTEERAAAEALARSEARYRSVVESMGEALLIADERGVVTFANGRVRDVLGHAPGEVVGRSLFEAVGWGVPREAVERRLRDRLAGLSERYEVPMERSDGARIWVDVIGSPFRDEQGRIVGSIAIFADVTARRRWQDALSESERRLAGIIDSAMDAIVSVDERQRVVLFSAAAEHVFGRPAEEVMGQPLSLLLPGAGAAEGSLRLAAREGGGTLEEAGLHRGRRRDGSEFPVEGTISQAVLGGDRITTLILRDVSAAMAAQEELAALVAREMDARERIQHLVESISDGFFAVDREWRFTFVNARAEREWGRGRAGLLGKVLWEEFPGLVDTPWERAYRAAMDQARDVRLEEYDPQQGRWWEARAYPSREGLSVFFQDTTERRRAEEALRASEAARREREEVLRAVVEGIADPVFLKDAAGRLVLANEATLRVLGRTADHVLGRTEAELLGEETGRRMRAADARIMGSGEPLTYEETIVGATGARTFLTTKVPWRAPDGSVVGVVGLARDVSDLKAAEQALRESEERLALVLTSTSDGLWDWTVGSEDVFYGPQWTEMLGYRPDEVPPRLSAWEELVHPDDLPGAWEKVAAHFAGETPKYEAEHRLRTADGGWKWVLARGKVVERAADGTPLRMVGTHVDIDERKRIQAELAASEREYRELFDNAHDAILILDPDERVLEVNARACEVYGIPRERFVGMEMVEISQDPEAGRRHARATLGGEGLYEFETVQRRADGSPLVLEVRARAITYGGQRAILSVNRDISGRRALEEQLRQAQKIEAVGRLAGGIAHDFNNVLMAVAGHAKLLLRRTPEDDPGRWSLEEIRRGTDRAAGLTRQLLAFSRQQILEPRVLDLNGVVTGVTPMLERLIGEDVELAAALDPHAGRVRADPGQVEQVIVNLAINARDAMPGGGVLRIETRPANLTRDAGARLPYVPPGRYVVLEVRDTGVGMDAATVEHAFEPFFTTKEPGRGTGLGLAMVYGIVKQSGGYIAVHSAPGEGTRFSLFFPRVDEPASPAEAVGSDAPPRRGSETVLVAEDDPGVRRLVATVLSAAGYAVLEAGDGSEALRRAEAHGGPIHLLLTDMVMPGMRTAELVARLRAMRPRLRVLAMSGYSEEALSAGGRGEVGGELVQKPVDPDALLRRVRELLDRTQDGEI